MASRHANRALLGSDQQFNVHNATVTRAEPDRGRPMTAVIQVAPAVSAGPVTASTGSATIRASRVVP